MRGGSLTVVGSGIGFLSQLTPETRLAVESAELALHDGDAATLRALRRWNPRTESLDPDPPRQATYDRIVDRILAEVHRGVRLCAVFYGHPGVFVLVAHEAVRRCRAEGIPARMLPGISAEDCLFADLGLDPGICGCQCFEATDFLMRRKGFDPASPLILWQVGLVGSLGCDAAPNLAARRVLVEALSPTYGPRHPVTLYQAAQFPVCPPDIRSFPLCELESAVISPFSTLYITPVRRTAADLEMARRLGIPPETIGGPRPGGRP